MTRELFREDAYLQRCEAVVVRAGEGGVVLDRTVFYPTGGGQPGDRGVLRTRDGREIPIVDTRMDRGSGEVLHVPDEGAMLPEPGAAVVAEIDWERRYRLMRTHTALHLLSALVPGAVTGGQVGEGRGRLDFAVGREALDREALQAELDRLVAGDLPVRVRWVEESELDANPELVRTLSVRPPRGLGRVRLVEIEGVDLQACGGTHVARTGEIGRVIAGRVENKGRQNRRVHIALAG